MFFLVAAAYSYVGTNLSNGGGEGGHDVRQAEAAYPERNASGWTQVCVDVAEVEPATFVFLYVVLPAILVWRSTIAELKDAHGRMVAS